MENKPNSTNKKSKKSMIFLLIFGLVLVLIAIIVILGYRFYKTKQDEKAAQQKLQEERKQNSTKPVNGTLLFTQ
jgi:flagellar basal body-associated protein FliL